MITFPPWGCAMESLLPVSSTHLLDMPCKVNDMILKHFLIKIERRTFVFCLQAVNYLTSTHNEQCKTSRNLIKRQRQGPSADGKWLTQLIKHPSVKLNMASLSHLKYGWVPLHISIFPFPFACGTVIAFIMLTSIYSASFIKVFMLVLTSLTNFLSLLDPNADKFEVANTEEIVKCSIIQVVFMKRLFDFASQKVAIEKIWEKNTPHRI